VEGMKFDRGFISPYFVTEAKSQTCELENPLILLCDGKISSIKDLVPALEGAMKANRAFLIVAEDVDGEALATLIVNKLRGSAKVVAVKAPGFGANRKAVLSDMAILTGAELFTEQLGMKLEECTMQQLGTAKKVTITKDDTLILDGAGNGPSVDQRCEMIRDEIELSSSEYEKEKLQERLAKLSGGVAVIRVGGASEVEVGEKKDRVVDALNATRAAVEEGIVPGGGTALLYASQILSSPTGLKSSLENRDQVVGVDIVSRACQVPARTIADNAGLEGSVVVGRLLKESGGDINCPTGLDASTGEFVNLIEAGIIDPTKVVRSVLGDSSGVSSLMITTEAMVVDAVKEE